MKPARVVATAALCGLLAACAVGPDYHRPAVDLPVTWKLEAPWNIGKPSDAVDKGEWWKRYGDAELDRLEQQALEANPSLAIAIGRLAQARATANVTSAGLFPELDLGARASKLKISGARPLTNYASQNFSTVQNDSNLSFNASYELDLFGRVQRAVEGAVATVQQSTADLANTRLLITTELAADYVNLRELDTELDVLNRSIALQRKALGFVTSRHEGGASSGLDVAQQQALLDTTLVQVDVLAKQRAQFEHAIASLIGTAAPVFTLPAELKDLTPPMVPVGVPSDILQRRPDVASAERAMAASNAQIGVATAAFYPSVMLSAALGGDSRVLPALFNASSLLWSFGVSATTALFDGGRTRARVDFARAGYDVSVATYRRTILTAMQEVQDGITGLAALDRASNQAQIAAADARRVLDLATSRYEGGASTYLDVITAQQAVLNTERQTAQLLGQRLLTSVFLVKALGGDWQGLPPSTNMSSSKPPSNGAANVPVNVPVNTPVNRPVNVPANAPVSMPANAPMVPAGGPASARPATDAAPAR